MWVADVAKPTQRRAPRRIAAFADLFLERKDYLRKRWNEAGVERPLDEVPVSPEGAEPEAADEPVLGAQSD